MKSEGDALAPGDRIRVFGGYDMDPEWIAGSPEGYIGEVIELLPGQNERPAALVELDEELVIEHFRKLGAVRGRYLVLELGHSGTDWSTPRPRIHVEVCDFLPAGRWQERQKGTWAESHATWEFAPG